MNFLVTTALFEYIRHNLTFMCVYCGMFYLAKLNLPLFLNLKKSLNYTPGNDAIGAIPQEISSHGVVTALFWWKINI